MVFVGTSEGVVRVPVANCSFYWSCAQCVLARDPFCGWDPDTNTCVEATTFKLNIGQDVDNANIEEVCNGVALNPRARTGPHKLPTASCPAGELVSVSLNEVVRLQCTEASRLARRHWQRPNSRLSADVYLQPEDRGLHFIATPVTMGHYLCLSTENGYQQTLVVYQVKQKSSPLPKTTAAPTRPHTQPVPSTQPAAGPGRGPGPPTFAGVWPKRTQAWPRESDPTAASKRPAVITRAVERNLTKTWPDLQGPREVKLCGTGEPSLLQELVVVSVLLALCLSLLIMLALYNLRQRCRSRTAPQANTPSRDSERGSLAEQEALHGGQLACSNSKHKGPAVNSGQPNGVMRNGTLKTSNGHLPNTPI